MHPISRPESGPPGCGQPANIMLNKIFGNLRTDFWGTWGCWQDRRPIWLLGGGAALFLEIFSWAFFQTYLGLWPCEMCVYIRFSMLVVFLGAMVAAIKPENPVLKLSGYIIVIWGLVRGIIWDITLEMENLRAQDDTWISLCSPSSASYPFGLPLDTWLPSHFLPLAACGEDSNWSLLGLNMAEWLFPIYALFSLGIILMLIGWLVRLKRARG